MRAGDPWRVCRACPVSGRHEHDHLPAYVVRHESDGLDELVARDATVHLERMSDDAWWLGIDLPDRTHPRVWIGSRDGRSEVGASCEVVMGPEK